MGLPIIGHLARKGFRTFATDVNPKKKAAVEKTAQHGWRMRPHWRSESDIVLVCVGFDHEVRELLEENQGRLKGSIVAILSTIHPKTVRRSPRRTRTST